MATDMIARALAAKAMQGAAGASEKEPLIVTFTLASLSPIKLKADTPYADIVEAANAGRIVYAFVPNPGPVFGQLSNAENGILNFNSFSVLGEMMNINMSSDSNITGEFIDILYRPGDISGGGNFNAKNHKIMNVKEPTDNSDAATKIYVDNIMTAGNNDSVIIKSSTPNSSKKFRITVDDAGAITATEVV